MLKIKVQIQEYYILSIRNEKLIQSMQTKNSTIPHLICDFNTKNQSV